AAYVAGFGVHYGQRKADGDCGVHRIAALAQDISPDLTGNRATRHHQGRRRDNHTTWPRVPALGDTSGCRTGLGGAGAVRASRREDNENEHHTGERDLHRSSVKELDGRPELPGASKFS
ncbi:MAG: hypothetical protein K0S99_2925, partial [Thermomicrobiales bacterium]|nr:hypothetical protein [Thermomicrobiales bacterium]